METLGTLSIDTARMASDSQLLARGERAGAKDPEEAAKDFEALLGTLLVKELRQSLPNGFFGKGEGVETFEGWFDEILGAKLADSGALELAGMLKASLRAKEESR
jgi:Rod binding domain-containing protein